ncbi:gustatory receptor for sugar taste 64b-like [Culicoides brevitarsis]|uniref:gustatory receptor for sugar taste 64b-like n=1 Tax=Culicoides brevitarsis TaxID=469753 RepID=UPI00307C9F17
MLLEHVHSFASHQDKKVQLFTKTKRSKNTKTSDNDFINEQDTFHRAVGPVFFAIQLFAIFPVKGVLNADIEKLHFKPISLQTIACVLLIVFNLIEFGLLLYTVPLTGIQSVAYVIFYSISIGAAFKFIRLAQRWKDFVRFIAKHEVPFTRLPYKKVANCLNLRLRIRLITFAILFLSGIEHGLMLVSNYFMIGMKADKCNMTITDFGEHWVRESRSNWLLIWDYTIFQIPLFEYANYAITYCWNFVDIMVMIMSIMIAYRFDQIYERVEGTKGRGMVAFVYPQNFWKEIRTHYVDVLRMLQKVNEEISIFVVLSFGNGIYFICLQFYNSFFDRPHLAASIYFWFSIAFLFLRVVSAVLCASMIHRSSLRLLKIMKLIPKREWDVEVQRLYDIMKTEYIGLSGKRYFIVSRKAMLVMASYIFTYELYFMEDKEWEDEQFVAKYCP